MPHTGHLRPGRGEHPPDGGHQRILDQYAKLDDYGRHTIASVIQVEYDRCTKTFEDGSDLRGGYSSVNLSAPVANDEPVSMNVLASRED